MKKLLIVFFIFSCGNSLASELKNMCPPCCTPCISCCEKCNSCCCRPCGNCCKKCCLPGAFNQDSNSPFSVSIHHDDDAFKGAHAFQMTSINN